MPMKVSDLIVKIDTTGVVEQIRGQIEALGEAERLAMFAERDANVLAFAMPVSKFWAIEPAAAFAYEAILNKLSISEMEELRIKAVERAAVAREGRGGRSIADYEVKDGNAIVPVIGVMTKRPHCLADLFGGMASTLVAERQLMQAMRDDEVKDISLYIESPGGDVAGAFDLANTIWQVRKKKPVYAYLADQATSAGYLIGSQANRVFGNDNVISGSMGVYTTLLDTSMANAQRGVKVHLVKAGKYKGIGVPGTPVSTEDLATVQQRIDAFHQLFIKAVNRGRMLSDKELAQVSDAQVYVGSQGVGVGLIDDIASFENAVEMGRSGKGRVRTKGKAMPQGTGSSAADNASEQDNINIDDVTRITNAIVASADDTTTGTPNPQAGAINWVAVASELGFANAETATKATIMAVVTAGREHDSMIRDAAKKMSIAAGYGNMDAHIDSLPLAAALSHLQGAERTVREKGLADGTRRSLSTDNGVVNNDSGKTPTAAGGAGDKRPAAEVVAETRQQLRNRGGYSIM